ncbi:hypothetical protein CDAR_59001 [Caerostris darwini]|uniref:Ycf15 n=1 Tax=Caerostris darwini TaxID=1538125 RepID=A0AAV4X1V3_9ARAC|nr:hypothetical protein CDAR_59001 [Caerostris darwini]
MGICVFRIKSSQKTRQRATRRGLLNDGPPLAVLSPLSLQSLPLLNHPVMYSNSFLPSISIQCAVIIREDHIYGSLSGARSLEREKSN